MTGKQSKKKSSLLSKLRKRKAAASRRPSKLLKTRDGQDKGKQRVKASTSDDASKSSRITVSEVPGLDERDGHDSDVAINRGIPHKTRKIVLDDSDDDLYVTPRDTLKGKRPVLLLSDRESDSDRESSGDAEQDNDGKLNIADIIERGEDPDEHGPCSSVFTWKTPSGAAAYDVVTDRGDSDVASPKVQPIRKSTRTRKATEKVAALAKTKKSTPTTWEESDSEQKTFKKSIPTDTVRTDLGSRVTEQSLPAPGTDATVVEDRDELLEHTYRGLVPLRAVYLSGSGVVGKTIMLSNWMTSAKSSINERFVIGLISFKSYASYINMSRIDPALLTPKTISKGSYVSFLLGNGAQLATCVSVIVVEESFIGQPGKTAGGYPKKELTGFFLSQEFERFAGVAGAVFGRDNFFTYAYNSAFKFSTYVDMNKKPSSDSNDSMFSVRPSPSSRSSPTSRAVLSYDSVVPLYDYRSERVFDPAIHLNPQMYGKLLPSHRDLPRRSLALVAYTTTNFSLRSGESGLGCNIMWAAVLAAPKDSGLPDPPSLLEQSPTKAAVARKKAAGKK
ncbi:hypothetical protein BJ138DRAFT_1118791 [Hygrophoropsis aurantiaca]|uniref:Uncharacterized protein n=1 Tax=Hygrophoropsis aurantiaca TaxID=72124 RepID=A0ACB7ZWQ0_9AGAM|nr:hypothetical protein BJ138DRAFT_1118791 [Hygrophoropsis aurantiaca]